MAAAQRRILGIDPGSVITGYAVIDAPLKPGGQPRFVAADAIRMPRIAFVDRLAYIFEKVGLVIDEHQPDEMVVEEVFVSKNPSSALKLGQARGAAICAGTSRGLPIAEYTPAVIKKSIVGRGAADKQQIQHMIRILLNLRQALQVDAADAAAVAMCHLHHSQGSAASIAVKTR